MGWMGHWGVLTDTTDDERDHEPCPLAYQLVGMEECCHGEENDEDYCCWHGRVVVVESEIRDISPDGEGVHCVDVWHVYFGSRSCVRALQD